MDCTKDIAEHVSSILELRLPEKFPVIVYPSYDHGVMFRTGEYVVFREYSILFAVSGRDLSDNNVKMGSPEFMQLFIDGPASVMAESIDQTRIIRDRQSMICARQWTPRKPSSAPYHWDRNFTWRGIPFELEATVRDAAFHVRMACVLATLESS